MKHKIDEKIIQYSKLLYLLNRAGGIVGELMVRRRTRSSKDISRAAMRLLKDSQRLVRYLDGYDDPNHLSS